MEKSNANNDSSIKKKLQEANKKLSYYKARVDQLEDLQYQLFENLADEVHVWELIRDETGEIKTWKLSSANHTALNSWGKTEKEVIGKTTDQIFGKGSTEKFMPIVKTIFSNQKPHRWIKYFEASDQYLKMSSTPLGEKFISTGKDITDEIILNNKLKEKSDLLNKAEEMSGQASWKYNIQTQEWSFSDNWVKIFGFSKSPTTEELIKALNPADLEHVREIFQEAIKGPKNYSLEHEITLPNGEKKWVKDSAKLQHSIDGEPILLVGITRDITKEREQTKELKKSKDFLTRIGKIAKVGGWQLEGDFSRVYLTDVTKEIYGLSKDQELNTDQAINFYHPDDIEMVTNLVSSAIDKGESYEFEARLISRGGKEKWVYSRGEPDMKDGKCVRLSGIIQDISERKKSDNKMKMLTNALEHSLNGFDIVDEHGKFIYVNKAHSRMFGYEEPSDIIGTTPKDLTVDPEFAKNLVNRLNEKKSFIGELKAKRKNGTEFDILMYSRLDYDEFGNKIYPSSTIDITERKQYERELIESERKYKNIADNLPGIILKYKLNPDGTDQLIYASDGLKDIIGVNPKDAVFDNSLLWNKTHREDIKEFKQSLIDSAQNFTPWKFETRIVLPGNRIKWIDFRGTPSKQKDKSIIWDTVGLDITKRKEAEFELEQVNSNLENLVEERAQKAIKLSKDLERYKLASEHSKTGLWYYDIRTNELVWDDTMFELFGVDEDEFSGAYEAWETSLHPEDLEENVKALQTTIQEKIDLNILFRIKHRKTGELRYIKGKGKTEADERGNTIAVFGINYDVTKEMTLAKEREKIISKLEIYQMAAKNAQVGIWVFDVKKQKTKWDDTLFNIYEFDFEDYPDRYIPLNEFMSIVLPEDIKELSEKLQKSIETGCPLDVMFRIKTQKTKQIKFIRSKGEVQETKSEELLSLYGTNWDVTKEMQLAIEKENTLNQLKETQAQLIQSEKMASLGVLTAGVAHELNNPLNYIAGGFTALEQNFKENNLNIDEASEYLSWIKTGTERATNIVKSLNLFSRSSESHTEVCNVHSILDDCLLMLTHRFDGKIKIIKKYTEYSDEIFGNIGKLHQVFLNILGNAMDAIKTDGEIIIETKSTENYLKVHIKDNGKGISTENLSKVFDPFFTTKSPGFGTGLGLSITHSIVSEHNGKIKITSKQNSQTTVKIHFNK